MRKRLLPFMLAMLLAVLLLSTAGHAVQHLGHDHDGQACPVCLVLCQWEKLLRRLLLAAAALSLLAAAGPLWAEWPLSTPAATLCAPTLVRLKVKLSN